LGFAAGNIHYWQGTTSAYYGGGKKFCMYEFPTWESELEIKSCMVTDAKKVPCLRSFLFCPKFKWKFNFPAAKTFRLFLIALS